MTELVPTEAAALSTSRPVGRTATFDHFTVTVGNVVKDPAHGRLVYTAVLVRSLPPGSSGGKTRISWDPWRVTAANGAVSPAVFDASHPPENMFPSSGSYGVDDGASGWLPYATSDGPVSKIRYANSLGDQATWLTPPRTADTDLGVTRTFTNFKVTVHQTTMDASGFWAGARIKVCVRSAAGFPNGVPISQTPWTISTNRGVFTTMIIQEGAPDFGPEFPWSTKLDVGECASGWVAFPLIGYGSGLVINQVNYHNSLGDAASWRAR